MMLASRLSPGVLSLGAALDARDQRFGSGVPSLEAIADS
ncbi:hypothetical protein PC116_g31437 [Phytophthora cactorum]|nr:hypothetical protein PC116_g31437 [Phytophthora cactorum]